MNHSNNLLDVDSDNSVWDGDKEDVVGLEKYILQSSAFISYFKTFLSFFLLLQKV